jgi:hypothetical protein
MVTEKREMFTLQFTTKTSLKVLIIFGSKLRLLKKEFYKNKNVNAFFSIFGLVGYLKDQLEEKLVLNLRLK